jgi:hypothetical protein
MGNMKKGGCLKIMLIAIVIFVILVIISAMLGDDSESTTESTTETTITHIYDNAETRDVMNGTRTEKLGEYSIINIASSEVTEEALNDWYFNYVVENDYNWCMILYSDKDDNSGVYAINGIVEENVYFEQDEYEDYMLGSSSDSTTYAPSDESLVIISD